MIPPMMGFGAHDLGQRGYAIGFIGFVFFALFSLSLVWVLKYAREASATKTPELVSHRAGRE